VENDPGEMLAKDTRKTSVRADRDRRPQMLETSDWFATLTDSGQLFSCFGAC